MPTYTYRCDKCGHEFERFQSMSDEPVKRCPECKGKVRRTFNPVGIVLKGSGFHKTDYRTSKPSSEPSGKEKSESTGEGSKTSDTKTSDGKTSDGKGSDSKSSGAKSSETRSSTPKD